MALNEDAEAIKEACDAGLANPAFKPETDSGGLVTKTFCNFFVQSVALVAKCDGLKGLMADGIFEYCSKASDWGKVTASQAATAAAQGLLVIAAHEYKPHGHVAIVYPGGALVFSGKWNCDVPILANVGERVGLFGANYCFPIHDTPPTFFLWTRKLPDSDQN